MGQGAPGLQTSVGNCSPTLKVAPFPPPPAQQAGDGGDLTAWAHREAASALTSERANFLSTRPLLALSFNERNALPFTEIIKAYAFDCRHVEAQVLASACVDERETAIGQSLYCAFGHFVTHFSSATN